MSDTPSRVIAYRYRLISQLGQGGMGRVWAAHDELLNRDVAIKEVVPPPGLTTQEGQALRERLMREARAIARLDHRNAVRIFDVLYERGEPWIVMELVPSRTLQQVLELEGRLSPDQVARIGLALLAALRAAHDAGLLHRDVKPANVLLGHDGRVVLTDFGLATAAGDSSITSTGIVLGSPSYLAPERALDHPVGPASDLWSLGATLYVAVEGTAPFHRSSPAATLAALATQPPRPPQRAGALTPALAGLLEKDPAKRATGETAERLLRQAVEPRNRVTPGNPPPDTADTAAAPAKPRRRRRLITAAAVLAVLAVAGAATRFAIIPSAAGGEARAPLVGQPPVSSGPQVPGEEVAASATNGEITASRSAGQPATAGTPKPPTGTKPATATTPATAETTKAATGRPFVNMLTGKCLDVPDASGTADVQMWDCQSVDNQRFTSASDGTLRVLGKCLQIRGTGNGARLRIATCTGASAQRFNYNSAYDLVSVQVDKCVDVTDSDSANGTPAQIWDCNGQGNQKWEY